MARGTIHTACALLPPQVVDKHWQALRDKALLGVMKFCPAYDAGYAQPPAKKATLQWPTFSRLELSMSRQIINTANAPAAIGPYSQAVRAGNTVYFSGQIPLDPATGEIVAGDVTAQARRAFDNLKAVAEEAGGSLDKMVRLGLYLTDLGEFAKVNAVMQEYFQAPFPARSTIEVSGLPKGAAFEVDAIMIID